MHAHVCFNPHPRCLPLIHTRTPQLDLLAGNVVHAAGARLDGGVLVDGRPRHMRSFRAISCYVQQKDVLLSSATVRPVLACACICVSAKARAAASTRMVAWLTNRRSPVFAAAPLPPP